MPEPRRDHAITREAERESAHASRRGPGASEARRARSARALDGPPGELNAERESAHASRRGPGASEQRSAREQRTGPRMSSTGPQMLIIIGADHGGVELKEALVAELRARGEEVLDV